MHLNRLLHILSFLLLGSGLLIVGCPTTSDDDDTAGSDDDDSTPVTDDDDDTSVADDDDDTTPVDDDDTTPVAFDDCTGPTVTFAEVEPNEGADKAGFNVIENAEGDLVITGTSSVCSNDGQTWTGDVDWFDVIYTCGGTATYTLTWTGSTNTDMDFSVFAPEIDDADLLATGQDFGFVSPETDGPVVSGGEHQIGVLCWEGDPVSWEFTIDWDSAPAGDDDDSVLTDDDDSTPADDDDTVVNDDDDTVVNDDDDTVVVDDDDTVVNDDDDSVIADDDDSVIADDDDTVIADDDDSVIADDDDSAANFCAEFCQGAQMVCTGANQQWASTTACEADCGSWALGTEGDTTGNTLACRGYHLSVAVTDPATHCPHVGPTGGGVCQ